MLVIRATRVLVAVAFGYLLFGISGEQFMALQESYAWSIGESINNLTYYNKMVYNTLNYIIEYKVILNTKNIFGMLYNMFSRLFFYKRCKLIFVQTFYYTKGSGNCDSVLC